MDHIKELRHVLGLPPVGERIYPTESHLSVTAQRRKEKARAANKRARKARRALRLASA